jgi:hypothetical protein
MPLSNEDQLRLNVLVRNVEALRIDESSMTVIGLSPKGEACVPLNANCRADQYLRQVREFFSSHVLGSPGGYPVHLKRWTRMGQARDTNLDALLMLGEPEAIMALVSAPALTDELARRAWWVAPTTDNACRMLEREAIIGASMGKVLVTHLVEHLPFEREAGSIIRIVRLILRTGLLDEEARMKLWKKGERQNTWRIGFLIAQPDELPDPVSARNDHEVVAARLADLARAGNGVATTLCKAVSRAGQTYIRHCDEILRRPSNQDAVVALLDAIGAYFAPARRDFLPSRDITEIKATLSNLQDDKDIAAVLRVAPELDADLAAVRLLAQVNVRLVDPIFAHTTAEGTLMRTKIEPVTTPIFEQFSTLRRAANG